MQQAPAFVYIQHLGFNWHSIRQRAGCSCHVQQLIFESHGQTEAQCRAKRQVANAATNIVDCGHSKALQLMLMQGTGCWWTLDRKQ